MTKRANGEGSIYLRKDGRYAASISIGKGKRKHFLNKSRAVVAARLAEAAVDQNKGIPVVSSNQTVAQYLTGWLASTKVTVRPSTYESYALNVRRVGPLIGKQRLSALKPASVERAYADLLDGGLSRRSVVQAHTVLHNALKKALQWGLVGRNPADAVSVPRPERHEMSTLSEDEVRTLFASTEGDDLHAAWVVLATTGLRLGEAMGLKWEDLDFKEHRLVVRRSLQRQREAGLVFVEPKTARSRRTVYFPEGTGSALKEHRTHQLEAKLSLGAGWQDNDLVFCRADGTPLEPTNVTHRFHAALKRAGLKQVRLHDLRHTAATLHLSRGENPKVVQEMLGHSTIAVTMDIYSHVTPALHAAAASKMQVLFGNG